MVNLQPSAYTFDLNTGLTQVLTDGTSTYLYGLGRIGEYDTDWNYYLTDALGSVRQLTDSTGAIAMAQSYAPYGDVTESAGETSTSYGYASEWTDGTGLQHLRARYLNTGIGRFVSRDTWGGDYSRPMSLNRWMYVEGNPIMRVDPSGLSYALGMAGLSFSQLSGSNYSNQNFQAMNVLAYAEDCDDLDLDVFGVDLKNPAQESEPPHSETSMAIYDYDEYQEYSDSEKWTQGEVNAIEDELMLVAAKYAEVINSIRYLKSKHLDNYPYIPLSPVQAFKLVHDGKVKFIRKNDSCNPNGGGCWAFTKALNEIWIYSNATADDIEDHTRIILHELGHAFNKRTGNVARSLNPAADGIEVSNITNFTRPTQSVRVDGEVVGIEIRHNDGTDDGYYGYCGGSLDYQFGYSGHSGSEEFADMFVGWVYDCWAGDDLGAARNKYMNLKMREFLYNIDS